MRPHELEPLPQEKSPSMKMKDRRGRKQLIMPSDMFSSGVFGNSQKSLS